MVYNNRKREKHAMARPEFIILVCQIFLQSRYKNVVGQFNHLMKKEGWMSILISSMSLEIMLWQSRAITGSHIY